MEISYHPGVRNEIGKLSKKDAAEVKQVIDLFGDRTFDLTKKHLKKLRRNLWELRTKRFRLLFTATGKTAVIVSILKKKTQKIPSKELTLAVNRLRSYET